MESAVTYTVFKLGQCQLHQLHTAQGRVFIAGEVAASLFGQSPTAFLQELRQGKYQKLILADPPALRTVAALGLPVESSAGASSAAALPPVSVQQLMVDHRRLDLLQPFKLALLKLASQEAARLMAQGEYEAALPVALDAVKQGEALFKPGPALQMFPLYLLAAQANLGLRRVQQCSDALRLAGLLALKEPALTTGLMRSQMARLNGQLAALQGKPQQALVCFAEDVYYCSLEYGPRDVRTSLGYFNLGKVLQDAGENAQGALACGDTVVDIWLAALAPLVLGSEAAASAASAGSADSGTSSSAGCAGKAGLGEAAAGAGVTSGSGGAIADAAAAGARCQQRSSQQLPGQPAQGRLPVGPLQLMEVADMLTDISRLRARERGAAHASVGAAQVAAALALVYVGEAGRALELLDQADPLLPLSDAPSRALLDAARAAAEAGPALGVGLGSSGRGSWLCRGGASGSFRGSGGALGAGGR